VPGLEDQEPPVDLPTVCYGLVTLVLEKHPRMSAHSHLLEPQRSQAMSSPLLGNSPLLTSIPFHPFASINYYIFGDEHVQAHTSTKSIDQLLSTYPTGHLAFQNHKDLFQIIDQATQAAPSVRSTFLVPF